MRAALGPLLFGLAFVGLVAAMLAVAIKTGIHKNRKSLPNKRGRTGLADNERQ